MRFKAGDKVRITKPTNVSLSEAAWAPSMDCWDGQIVTLDDYAYPGEPFAWTVQECNWVFEESWMTPVDSVSNVKLKFKKGDKVSFRRPDYNHNTIVPMWRDAMDLHNGEIVTLCETAEGFPNSWQVESAFGKKLIYAFQEDWMTLVESPKVVKEEKKVEKKITESKITGPAVKTNDFPTWEGYETTNPALHMLYVNWAMNNLKTLKNSLRKLNKVSQETLHSAKTALQREIQKLVETDPAYRHAAALLFAGVQPLPNDTTDPRYPLISEVIANEEKAKSMPKVWMWREVHWL